MLYDSAAVQLVASSSQVHSELVSLIMPRQRKRQRHGHLLQDPDSFPSSDDENTPPAPPDITLSAPKPKRTTLGTQILEKDAKIAILEANISARQEDLIQLRKTHEESIEGLGADYRKLLGRNGLLSLANKSLNTLKRKAESHLTEELAKKHKRIRRLERDRRCKQEKEGTLISSLQDTITTQSH